MPALRGCSDALWFKKTGGGNFVVRALLLLRHDQDSAGDFGSGGSNSLFRQRPNGHPSHWYNNSWIIERLHKSGKSRLLKLEHREKFVLAETNASMFVALEQREKQLPTEKKSSLSLPSLSSSSIFFGAMNDSPVVEDKAQLKLSNERLALRLDFASRYLLRIAETNSCSKKKKILAQECEEVRCLFLSSKFEVRNVNLKNLFVFFSLH